MKTKTVDEFIAGISVHYPSFTKISSNLIDLKKTAFNKNECFFIWDLVLGEIVYANGIETLLGFKDDELTLQEYTELFHPDEMDYVLRIGQAATYHSIENPELNKDLFLYVSHRIRKSNGLDAKSFHDIIFENSKSVFTQRELEVISEIRNGHTNIQIAENLQISKFTVSSHRKNILKKSNCHSAEELLLFCQKNGI